jgi:Nucleotidyl transferase AbiEii toxin, Type IV TA system
LRAALEDRLANRSRGTGIDLERLRRRAAFERLLVRLELGAPGRWIVKGGMALEVRLGDRARSTRDLDLALREAAADGGAVRDLLIDCLLADPDSDGFEFRIGNSGEITDDDAGRPGWRYSVESRLAGRRFATVRLDVVARANEITSTQRVSLPGILDFAEIARHTVEVVDPLQHFAEKIHTLTRSYGDRPNSRVRDLADIVLLIEDGLHPTSELLRVVAHLFDERNMHPLPQEIADPPPFWRESYPTLVADLDLTANSFNEAVALVRQF